MVEDVENFEHEVENDVEIEVLDEEEVAMEEEAVPAEPTGTLNELLPENCIIIFPNESKEPEINVRGEFADLGEGVQFLQYALSRLRFFKHMQDKSKR